MQDHEVIAHLRRLGATDAAIWHILKHADTTSETALLREYHACDGLKRDAANFHYGHLGRPEDHYPAPNAQLQPGAAA